MILDGAALSQQLFGEDVGPREHLVRFYPDLADVIPPLDHVVRTARPLVARVNHGVWVASCECGARGTPTPGCVVWFDAPLGWCCRCRNQATGRGWRPVLVPDEAERERIEDVLLCRPNVENRNWEPSETIANLVAQNREYGDPVPPENEPLAPVHGPDWRTLVVPFSPLVKQASWRLRRVLRR